MENKIRFEVVSIEHFRSKTSTIYLEVVPKPETKKPQENTFEFFLWEITGEKNFISEIQQQERAMDKALFAIEKETFVLLNLNGTLNFGNNEEANIKDITFNGPLLINIYDKESAIIYQGELNIPLGYNGPPRDFYVYLRHNHKVPEKEQNMDAFVRVRIGFFDNIDQF